MNIRKDDERPTGNEAKADLNESQQPVRHHMLFGKDMSDEDIAEAIVAKWQEVSEG